MQSQTKCKLNYVNFITGGSVISNTFNDFFIDIGRNHDSGVSPIDYMGQPLVNNILLSEVTTNEISKIWGSLRNGATEHAEINACLLKLVLSFIAEPLMYLCYQSLS